MGWQRQAHGPSVQQAIEEAIRAITHETVTLHAAGRTDAGVHALAMTAHVDIEKPITPHRLADGTQCQAAPPARRHPLGRGGWRGLPRPLLLCRAALSLPNREPPRATGAGGGAGLAGAGRAPCGQDERSRASAGRPSRFHDLPLGSLPVGQPGQDARPADRAAARRDDRNRGRGAELPPPPGAFDGRLPASWSGAANGRRRI